MPNSEKAETLKIDPRGWETVSDEFVVSMWCKFGPATAGEHTDFTVAGTLKFVAGQSVELTGARSIVKQAGAVKDSDGYIAIEPLRIGWDRNGGTFSGDVTVEASASIVGPSGQVVSSAATVTKDITIPSSGTGTPLA